VLAGALAALVGVVGFGDSAHADVVGNPGNFSFTVSGGSIAIKAQIFDLTPNSLPECADGVDNEADNQAPPDGLVDFPADPQCASATDNSELVSGEQPKQDLQLAGTIDANGNVVVPTSGVVFPTSYLYVDGAGVITVTILATHAATGTLNPVTGDVSVRVRVRIKLTNSLLGANCYIGTIAAPVDVNTLITGTTAPPPPNLPISGVPYNPVGGTATLVNNSFGVPGATGCGLLGVLNGVVNGALGLPSGPGNNSIELAGVVTPILVPPSGNQPPTASFTATPSSGAAPLAMAFNAAASSDPDGTIVSYAWSFGDGNFGSGPAANHIYNTPGTYNAALTVTDDDGATDTDTKQIVVSAAPSGDTVSVHVTGDFSYTNSANVTAGGVTVTQLSGAIKSVTGSATLPSTVSGDATFTVSVHRVFSFVPTLFSGKVVVTDPAAGISLNTKVLFVNVTRAGPGNTATSSSTWFKLSGGVKTYRITWTVNDAG
jgi:PKD repeat protein